MERHLLVQVVKTLKWEGNKRIYTELQKLNPNLMFNVNASQSVFYWGLDPRALILRAAEVRCRHSHQPRSGTLDQMFGSSGGRWKKMAPPTLTLLTSDWTRAKVQSLKIFRSIHFDTWPSAAFIMKQCLTLWALVGKSLYAPDWPLLLERRRGKRDIELYRTNKTKLSGQSSPSSTWSTWASVLVDGAVQHRIYILCRSGGTGV